MESGAKPISALQPSPSFTLPSQVQASEPTRQPKRPKPSNFQQVLSTTLYYEYFTIILLN